MMYPVVYRYIALCSAFAVVIVKADTAQSCNSSLTANLRDDQFYASSQINATHKASAAKKNGAGWIADTSTSFQYLQIDLGRIFELTAIDVQAADTRWYIYSFRISYSLDGKVWFAYNTRLSDDPLGEIFERTGTVTRVTFAPNIQTRYIAINPKTFSYNPSLRIELYGCEKELPVPSQAVTTISADIETDTTWIPSQSPIVIDRPVVVYSSSKLTIQPGVSIIFTTENAGIQVYGTLSAEGVSGLEVLFSSDSPVLSAKSNWQGLSQGAGGIIIMKHATVRQAHAGIQGHGSRIQLATCTIFSCQYGLRLSGGLARSYSKADEIPENDINLMRLNVHNNEDGMIIHGMFGERAFIIGHSKFEHNKNNGISISNSALYNGSLAETDLFVIHTSLSFNKKVGILADSSLKCNCIIHNSSFVGNENYGFLFSGYNVKYTYGTITISDSVFSKNGYDAFKIDCTYFDYFEISNVSLINNHFSGHSWSSVNIRIYMYTYNTWHYTVFFFKNNTFVNNYRGINVDLMSKRHVDSIIDGNVFTQVRFPIRITTNDINTPKAVIHGNKFTDITSTSRSDIAVLIEVPTADITNNTFVNCSISSIVTLTQGYNHYVSFNTFVNSSLSPCYVTLKQDYHTSKFIKLDQNYWDTYEKMNVKIKVCDFFYDSTKVVAVINNYSSSPQMDTILASPDVDAFRHKRDQKTGAYIVGGTIEPNMDLPFQDGDTLIVNRSILIRSSANLELGQTVLNFTASRGIAVYGKLVIGGKAGVTYLQKNGTDDWNGIAVISAEVVLKTTKVADTSKLFTVFGNNTTIFIDTLVIVENIQQLISAEYLNGQHSITVSNSSINTLSALYYVRTNDSRILNLNIDNSIIKSNEYIIDAREINNWSNNGQIILNVTNSSLISTREWLFYFSICNNRASFTIADSMLFSRSLYTYHGTIYIRSPSLHFSAKRNRFSDTRRAMDIQLCDTSEQFHNYSHIIDIDNNVFNSSVAGESIYFYRGYRSNLPHHFRIANNIFDHGPIESNAIVFNDPNYQSYTLHTLIVESNFFRNMISRIIQISHGFGLLSLRNNTFQNNSQCIHLSGSSYLQEINDLKIVGNIFVNNTNQKGILFLDIQEHCKNNFNITNNTFENNLGIVVAFKCPQITINYNFFENDNALYNLKSLLNTNTKSVVVNATFNYWGTTNIREITKKLYNTDNNGNIVEIVPRPYLGSRNFSDIRDDEVSHTFLTGNEIGGHVNGNITLFVDNSPYLAVANIEVDENDTLIIEAGVVIAVQQDVGINVVGRLNILGSAEKPVTIKSNTVGLPWKGIIIDTDKGSVIRFLVINDTQQGLTVKGPSNDIRNTVAMFSKSVGITVDISKMYSLKLTNIYVAESMGSGIYVTGNAKYKQQVSLVMTDCVVERNSFYGMYIDSNIRVELKNCTLQNNKKSGIIVRFTNSAILHINDSVISSNFERAIDGYITDGIFIQSSIIRDHNYGYWYYNSWFTSEYIVLSNSYNFYNRNTSVVIRDSQFLNNVADGIRIHSSNNGFQFNIVLEGNRFFGGNKTFTFTADDYYFQSPLSFEMTNNIIEYNKESVRSQTNRLFEFSIAKSKQFIIRNNRFRNNTADTGLFIMQSRTSSDLNFVENAFLDNKFTSDVLHIFNQMNANVFRNKFKSPLSPKCILRVPKFDLRYFINATHNYWGTGAVKDVTEKVCSFDKDMDKMFVQYLPYYIDDSFLETSQGKSYNFNISGVFGGVIDNDLTISKSQFPLGVHIDRSMIIRPGVTLTIEDGVSLYFAVNRGIYIQGILKAMGETEHVRLVNEAISSVWYGIVFNSTYSDRDYSLLYKTDIFNTSNGLIAHTRNLEIRRSHVMNSASNCLTLTQDSSMKIYDFEMTVFEDCSGHGIYISKAGSSSIVNAIIQNATVGVGSNASLGLLEIRACNISNTRQEAVNISYLDLDFSGNITVESCNIVSCGKGLVLKSKNRYSDNYIKVSRNVFNSIKSDVLNISYQENRQNNVSIKNKYVSIYLNEIHDSCGIFLETWNNANLTFKDNVLSNSSCFNVNQCYITGFANGNEDASERLFEVSANVIQNISGFCIVRLKTSSSEKSLDGMFIYNQILFSRAVSGVVSLEATRFKVTNNIFDNPVSPVEVYTDIKGSNSVNVTRNWWGSLDANRVYQRIFDQTRDPSLILFNVTPVLTERHVGCSGVNNCSNHGDCISPNRCRCNSGWSGSSCSDYECAAKNDCYDNGLCVGPNKCDCHIGWSGTSCTVPSCNNVNSCSGNGICVRPGFCSCAAKFTGNDCSSCVDLHWGPECRPCPDCQHGACDLDSGMCICDGNNWSGYLCDKCSDKFYGPICLPLIKVLYVLPSEGSDKGGELVHVWGHNFPETVNHAYICRFGTSISNGTWVTNLHVVCQTPKHQEGKVFIEISSDGKNFTNDRLTYFFRATCPSESCGQNVTPSRGQCLFGLCSCFLPWTGENCSTEMLAPRITKVTDEQSVVESSNYTLQLSLDEGHRPVQWRLIKGPVGLKVDETGLVSWNYAFANSTAYHIEVQAINTIGKDVVTWLLHVPASYSVEIERIEPSGVISLPRPINIYGYVMFSNTATPHVVPVDVIVFSNRTGKEFKLRAMTNSLAPNTFITRYTPRPDDAGAFTVRSGRPGPSDSRRNLTWSVLGLQCSPSKVDVSERILSENSTVIIRNLSVLLNIGEFPVENITSKVDYLPGAFIRKHAAEENSVFFLPKLSVDDAVHFDLVIPNAAPLHGTIYVLFISKGGTTTHLRVGISLSISKPVLVFAPSSVRENVLRGTQKILNIQMTNIGEVDANRVQISLPNNNRLALVSFSTVRTNNEVTISGVATNASITAGGSAYMTLSVTIPKTEPLGEMMGTIYINSEVSSTPLSYRFYIVSLQKFNLTFKVKDEFTYFAADSPLVSNAIVKLVNPRQGYSETKYTTNATDGLLFEDIVEDQYTLYVKADGHTHYSAVILVTRENTQFDIFLQRIAVKYTWTVTPTDIEDKYVITLDSTFETYVPMPVVTVEPAKVNTIPFELGESETILFNITNHGLIRADNLRFNLPTDHPYLIFESTIDFLGNLDANTSIIVPVKTIVRNRRAVGVVCGMGLLYDIYCGGVRTKAVGITLTREYPGAPHLPCYSIWSSGHGGSGVLWSGSIAYAATTPLTCDCAKTFIKSCVLGFNPIFACAFALEGLISLDSNGSDPRSTILAIADIVFGCFPIPAPYGLIYTAIRCLMDVNEKCVGGKRKREVSSDVVYNLLSTAKQVENFLAMMTEIQGGEELSSVETSWYQAFKKTVGENTELGTLLSDSEATSVLSTLKDEASKTKLLNGFLKRWNNTAAAWENGTLYELGNTDRVISFTILNTRLKRYFIDNDRSTSRGFSSIFDEYNYAVKAYRAAEQQQIAVGGSEKEGICARVRVKITQDLILTREAFNARLEIENGENFDLKNIEVLIEIKETLGNGKQLNNKFSIGTPNLIGITGIDGVGWLGKGLSGSAEWLIIPHADAAPQDDTLYDVGGRLSYVVDGSPFTVPLLPDTITVKPNPSLVVHYFHEKYVQGDDAMTDEVEPIVPFSLAVLVKNNGYGVARALRITSAQPEIIENEKGLLISFKIIAAQLGDSPITPSLSVNFGDIPSFATKTARWLMTSTLAGTFFNYSATFENINPMGDPQLSLIDKIGYHELFHLVRMELPAYDDKLDDFLVNDFVDQEGIPDRLYNSANGTDIADVYQGNVTDLIVLQVTSTSNKVYTHVKLKVNANSSVWFYTRLENTFISSKSEQLLSATDGSGRALFVDKNVWETTHILDKHYLHIFDFIPKNNSGNDSERIEHEYFLIYGPRNIYAPNFNSTAYSATIPSTTGVGFEVLTVNAYDVDKDDLVFRFESNFDSTFKITKTTRTSAVITVNRRPLGPGEQTLLLIVEDLGIPSKSSSANLTIFITDTNVTTHITMSSTTSSAKPINTTTKAAAVTTTNSYTSLTTTFTSVSTLSTKLTTNFTDVTRSPQTSTNRLLSSTSSSQSSDATSNSSSITSSTQSVAPSNKTQKTEVSSSSNLSTYVLLKILPIFIFIIYIN